MQFQSCGCKYAQHFFFFVRSKGQVGHLKKNNSSHGSFTKMPFQTSHKTLVSHIFREVAAAFVVSTSCNPCYVVSKAQTDMHVAHFCYCF